MKAVFVLLFFSCSFALTLPLLDEVGQHNSQLTNFLENNFNPNESQSTTFNLNFGTHSQQFQVLSSIEIIGMSHSIDELIYPTNGLSLLVARGYYMDHLASLPTKDGQIFTCNQEYNSIPYCDFDNDGCPEFEQNTSIDYQMDVIFTFKNSSFRVPFSSTHISIPDNLLEEMKTSSGADIVDVTIEGDAAFIYVINDRRLDGVQCVDNFVTTTNYLPISINKSFIVAGENKLFFLRSPILREQLTDNNHFDVVLLSQAPLYYGEILLDGNKSKNFSFRSYSIEEGPYGIEKLISNTSTIKNFAEHGPNVTTPVSLEKENYSFAYGYEFNFTYVGIGKHNLSLLVMDPLLTEQYNETIISRALSYNGIFGNDSSLVRPSLPYTQDQLNNVQISLGLVALVVFLAFVNFWVTR
ncbi:Uncharacterised protein [Candidatus Bilamarchaeum dharawalense]|uniref:Uncharacterized protein n=1 Tax=Candidatus Bilamarchaeum dharawalense TaxID=2885759 RepID=A0A5E4LTC4_9ARCH|nr:Uncharacterised protein [Candidatus Bilamarchaeum dharawalense]